MAPEFPKKHPTDSLIGSFLSALSGKVELDLNFVLPSRLLPCQAFSWLANCVSGGGYLSTRPTTPPNHESLAISSHAPSWIGTRAMVRNRASQWQCLRPQGHQCIPLGGLGQIAESKQARQCLRPLGLQGRPHNGERQQAASGNASDHTAIKAGPQCWETASSQ